VFSNAFYEFGSDLYYSRGSEVYVVHGNRPPKTVVRAAGKVTALTATLSDLFVQTGLRITMYRLPGGAEQLHWALPGPAGRVIAAGMALSVVDSGWLWSWTRAGRTGAAPSRYATLYLVNMDTSAISVVSRYVYPGTMNADPEGVFFESANKAGTRHYLGEDLPIPGARMRRTSAARGGPLAIGDQHLYLLIPGRHPAVNTYSQISLGLTASKPVSVSDETIAGGGSRLAVLRRACQDPTCSAVVSNLDAATGHAYGGVRVPGAVILVPGPWLSVIEVSHGEMTMQRIS
jgi:hypothetical protein